MDRIENLDCLLKKQKELTLRKKVHTQHEMEFYKKQERIALRNCGLINPELIEEYIANRGYEALGRCLLEMSPKDVIHIIKTAGLRGRGGGGFPTGLKWEYAAKQNSHVKYVVCNADEGDPGAFMDRSILEGDPHSVIEAMTINGYAIGANRGFVCGEETALIHSIEGGRGEPTTKPPFPAESGLWGKPTSVNNVETFANVPAIIINGASWYNKFGSHTSKGTKVFALAGKINNVGLVEVPMGITLREIIYDIGGGIKDGKKLKAVQTGGPSGGCITADQLDVEIDYESLYSIGSMMGSGGMIVIDEDNCIVDIAKFYLEFTVEESCGKCTPCRVGNKRLYEMLTKITEGKGTEEDLETMRNLAETIKLTSLCGLGQTAPNPVLSTMKYFYDEYLAHVRDKKCPAGVCQALLKYHISEDKCLAVCPTAALAEVNNVPTVWDAINDEKKFVVVQTVPAVRVALGEEFGMEPRTVVTGKMVAALRSIGFDKVFDTDFAADLTIMEEASPTTTETLKSLKKELLESIPRTGLRQSESPMRIQ